MSDTDARTRSSGTTTDTERTDTAAEAGAETVPQQEEHENDELRASWLPWAGEESEADVVVKLYIVTGKHGGLRIPGSFCRECHMFARRADMAAEQVDADVEVNIYSWWTHVLGALRHAGYHPPVMVVGGKHLCQGHDVPTTDEVVTAIEAALDRTG
ncbi:MAG: hypothetical protein V5A55_05425 [Halovenus sp.]